jgi:DNA-binding NarL/FixJ family response regulator
VVISGTHSSALVRAALLAGASGFVPKTASPSELLAAIEAAAARGPFFVRPPGTPPRNAGAGVAVLTERQRQVLQLIAEGMSTREIAIELGVSLSTADTHRAKLMEKLDLHKVSDLVRYAIREGIVSA